MKSEFKPKKPFFMTNQDWYEYDVETNSLILTNKAPKAAIDSYNDIYSSKNDIFSSNDNAEYKAAINEELIRLSNDRDAIELFGINLELLELKRKYEEIHNFPVIKNILDENVEIPEELIERLFECYPLGWNDTPDKLKIEFLKKAIEKKKKIEEVTNYYTEGVFFDDEVFYK